MKKIMCAWGLGFLAVFGFPVLAQAYSGLELKVDCLAAERWLMQQPETLSPMSPALGPLAGAGEGATAAGEPAASDTQAQVAETLKAARCLQYLEGFAEGYAVGEHLAGKVGVQIQAFCPPSAAAGPDYRIRLVRAVLGYLDRQPPLPAKPVAGMEISASVVTAAAWGHAFECREE